MADSQNLVLKLLITAKDEASAALGGLKTKLGDLGEQAASLAKGGLAALGAALTAIFKHGLDAAADFETVMARIQAAGVRGQAELERLADAAKKLGAESGAGPARVAEALENLVKAGLSANDALAVLPQVIALAQGQMMSMAEASDLVVKTVNQFGLEFADSQRVVDLFATGANSAATSVQDLRQGLENAAVAARANGLSLEQTIAALNTLIQNGVPAAEAGEALQNMLLELSNASGQTYQQLLAAGTATTGFNGALELLNQGGPRAREFLASFGETALTAAQILANSQPFYQDQVKQLSAIGVSAQDAAKIMGGTFQSSLDTLKATLGEFGQALAEPYLPKLTEGFKDATRFITENRQALSDWITAGLSPVTQAVDGFRIAIAMLGDDQEKVAKIQAEIEARTAAIGRALNGTSNEYYRAATAAKTYKDANEDTTASIRRQIEATHAVAESARTYAAMAKDAAAGSELQSYYFAQSRLEAARYREELAKLPPEQQKLVAAQQAGNAALQQTGPAAQAAAQGVAEIRWATQDSLPTQQAYRDGANAMTGALAEQTAEWYRQLPAQERLALSMAAYTESAGRGKDQTTQLTEEIARVRQASDGWRSGLELNVVTLNSLRDVSELTAQQLARLEERQRAGEKLEQEIAVAKQAVVAAQTRYTQALAENIAQQERAVAAQERMTQLGQQEADLNIQRAQSALTLAQTKGDANEIQRAENDLLDASLAKIDASIAGQKNQIAAYDELVAATQRQLAADGELDASDRAQLATMADKRAAMALELQGLAQARAATEEKAAAEQSAAAATAQAAAETERKAEAEKQHAEQVKAFANAVDVAYSLYTDAVQDALAGSDRLAASTRGLGDEFLRTAEKVRQNAQAFLSNAIGGEADRQRAILSAYAGQLEQAAYWMDRLATQTAAGTVTLQDVAGATRAAELELSYLDEQDLDQLRGAIADASAKLRDMQEETQAARDRLAELNAELLEAQGQDQKAQLLRQQLDYQQQLAEIERQRAEAEAARNTDLLATLAQQKAVLEEINRVKQATIKAEAEEARAAAAKTSATTAAAGSSTSGVSSGRTYTLNLTSGRSTLPTTTTTNPQTFLDEVEAAQRRST